MSIDVFLADAPVDVHLTDAPVDVHLVGGDLDLHFDDGDVDVVLTEDTVDVHLGLDGPFGPEGPMGPPGGTQIRRIALGPVSGHRVVRTLGLECAYASCDDIAQAEAVVGVSLNAAASGDYVWIANQEEVQHAGWAFSEGPVFLGFAGGLVQPAPTPAQGAAFIRQIGVAVAPDRLLVQLRPPIFIS